MLGDAVLKEVAILVVLLVESRRASIDLVGVRSLF